MHTAMPFLFLLFFVWLFVLFGCFLFGGGGTHRGVRRASQSKLQTEREATMRAQFESTMRDFKHDRYRRQGELEAERDEARQELAALTIRTQTQAVDEQVGTARRVVGGGGGGGDGGWVDGWVGGWVVFPVACEPAT